MLNFDSLNSSESFDNFREIFKFRIAIIDVLTNEPIVVINTSCFMFSIKIPTIGAVSPIMPLSNKKTGEVYANEEALKAANIPEDDIRRDVKVIMPPLDLFSKTK